MTEKQSKDNGTPLNTLGEAALQWLQWKQGHVKELIKKEHYSSEGERVCFSVENRQEIVGILIIKQDLLLRIIEERKRNK